MAVPLTPEALVTVFATGWALPKPAPFIEHFVPHLHPDVVLRQPGMPPAHGVAGFARVFHRLFALMPDFTVDVEFWAASADTVLIISTAHATVGRRAVSFAVCDRFDLLDGLIARRDAIFDPTPLRHAIAGQPRLWAAAARLRKV